MNPLDLSDKTILITGGAGAIGRVILATLADHGAHVAVNDILPQAQGEAIVAETGVPSDRVAYFHADANDPLAVNLLLEQVSAWRGLPQVVCCHAGTVDAFPVEQYPLDRFDRLMQINLRAAFVTAQVAARHWIEAGVAGLLIFTTSWVQDVPWPEITPYNASKAGMKAIMRGFARELAPKGIRANAVAPGIVGVGLPNISGIPTPAIAPARRRPSRLARCSRRSRWRMPFSFFAPPWPTI
jgi:NAD(P)-dependent dehydrogenase (short-subunit alcohol dehydrogenase family)